MNYKEVKDELRMLRALLGTLEKEIEEQAGVRKVEEPVPQISNLSTTQKEIVVIFRNLGVPVNIMGYSYLREAVSRAVEDPTIIYRTTKELYPTLAKKFNTTPSRVERAIRHAIERTWDCGSMEDIERYFGNTVSVGRGKPTNSQFIAVLADYILMKGEDNEMD